MAARDGNGWTRCDRGHRHWGRHGAAGLLLAAPGEVVLLHRRSGWGSYGGSWGPPGGARDSHESAVTAALREAAEECAIDPFAVAVHGVSCDDHGGWAYQTVLATSAVPLAAAAVSEETREVAWVPAAQVDRLRLHPGFGAQWPSLRMALAPVTVIVDAANVIGSRPDGWWRDRAGAAAQLLDDLAWLAARGVDALPESAGFPVLERWFPRFVVVLEGKAAAAAAVPGARMTVVRADGSGDDEVVRQAAGTPAPCLVVTADRALRARCEAAGASVIGPRWLVSLLARRRPAR
jgi:8-oxo-dGTP pyrophosphatase MutT (NUDIX family)